MATIVTSQSTDRKSDFVGENYWWESTGGDDNH